MVIYVSGIRRMILGLGAPGGHRRPQASCVFAPLRLKHAAAGSASISPRPSDHLFGRVLVPKQPGSGTAL
jgi:hypothetical protein